MASEKTGHNARDLKRSGGHPIEDLIELMRRLREPETGCPWDLEQDFRSIAPYTIEEAYEVMDAIEQGDMDNLREELGDLLLQPIYHAQMAAEKGLFTIEDVIRDVTEKMHMRHPHVFGDLDASDAEAVNQIWDQRKKAEKEQRGEQQSSALGGVTLGLPALLRAQKLQKKAAKIGFEWTDPNDILDKLDEEISELRQAINRNDPINMHEEMGDMLFVMANIARHYKINAEDALRECNNKFIRRFKGMEEDFDKKGKALKDASLDQMMQMWVTQKQKEHK